MRVATFNANSIRNRLETILEWLIENSCDIIGIQETKCQDKDFPIEQITEAGFNCIYRGQKSFNGVAIISRHEMQENEFKIGDEILDQEARFIKTKIGDVTFINTYVPQGQEIDSLKFETKLKFLERLYSYLYENHDPMGKLILVGDINIASRPQDVYDPQVHWGGVGFNQTEIDALDKIKSFGLYDTLAYIHGDKEGIFTFWDYRIPAAVRRKMGWRLDYVLVSKPMVEVCKNCYVDIEPRNKPKSSDHTFLVSDFDVNIY